MKVQTIPYQTPNTSHFFRTTGQEPGWLLHGQTAMIKDIEERSRFRLAM